MKKTALLIAVVVAFCLTSPAQAAYNWNAKFQLHYAGAHDSKAHTCAFTVTTCSSEIVVDGGNAGRYDVYLIAIDTEGIAGMRYGMACTGDFYFYGWTSCSDLEIGSAGCAIRLTMGCDGGPSVTLAPVHSIFWNPHFGGGDCSVMTCRPSNRVMPNIFCCGTPSLSSGSASSSGGSPSPD